MQYPKRAFAPASKLNIYSSDLELLKCNTFKKRVHVRQSWNSRVSCFLERTSWWQIQMLVEVAAPTQTWFLLRRRSLLLATFRGRHEDRKWLGSTQALRNEKHSLTQPALSPYPESPTSLGHVCKPSRGNPPRADVWPHLQWITSCGLANVSKCMYV